MAKDADIQAHEKGQKKAQVVEPVPQAGNVEIEITTKRAGFPELGSHIKVSEDRASRWHHRGYAKIVDKRFAAEAEKVSAEIKKADPGGRGEVETPPRDLPNADGRGGKNQE